MALIYCIVLLPTISLFMSLVVDLGILYYHRDALQDAADAAAHAGACQLLLDPAAVETQIYQVLNQQTAKLPNADFGLMTYRVGFYDNTLQRFTLVGTGLPDTVEVTLKRTAATGHAVELPFLKSIGGKSADMTAVSVARLQPKVSPQPFIGVDRVKFSSLGVLSEMYGDIASNGPVDIGVPLGLFVRAREDVYSFSGPVTKGALAQINGTIRTLDAQLVCPPVEAPAGNNNVLLTSFLNGSGDFTSVVGMHIPAGTYVVRNLNLVANVAVTIDGPVTFYVSGSFNVAAAVNLLGNTSFDPNLFKVRVLPGGQVNFIATIVVPISMDLYAPGANITIAVGINSYKGRLVGKELNILLPLLGRFDGGLGLTDPLGRAGTVAIVK